MSIENLLANAALLEKQLFWLQHSFNEAKAIGIKNQYTINEFDIFENLSSRFSRTVDFLIRKVFRSIDDVEFENQGTLIDVVNNAHKRNLFQSINEIREIKDLRNSIAHEYIDDELQKLFEELLISSEVVIIMVDNTLAYIERLKNM
jgi:hypothetical protein